MAIHAQESAKPIDLLTGFLGKDGKMVNGRPVGVITDAGARLLVADDVGNMIWRVSGTAGATIAGALPPSRTAACPSCGGVMAS